MHLKGMDCLLTPVQGPSTRAWNVEQKRNQIPVNIANPPPNGCISVFLDHSPCFGQWRLQWPPACQHGVRKRRRQHGRSRRNGWTPEADQTEEQGRDFWLVCREHMGVDGVAVQKLALDHCITVNGSCSELRIYRKHSKGLHLSTHKQTNYSINIINAL